MKNFTETMNPIISVYSFIENAQCYSDINEFRNHLADFKFEYESNHILNFISDIDSFLSAKSESLVFAIEIQTSILNVDFDKLDNALLKLMPENNDDIKEEIIIEYDYIISKIEMDFELINQYLVNNWLAKIYTNTENESTITQEDIDIINISHQYSFETERNTDDWMSLFFMPENEILPAEEHLKYKNILYSKSKKPIDIKKESWKVFAVLMVWAENEKLDLSVFDNKPKSKKLNVKVAHFMAKYFTYQGKIKDNSYYNSDVFPMISKKSLFKHNEFNARLYTVCGKLNFTFPESLQRLP